MLLSPLMSSNTKKKILCIIGTTASGKSARAVTEAYKQNGEIISVDSRQVYSMLDIGTEKITKEEMMGIPHHLIDIRDPRENYSAGDFVNDASKLVEDIYIRGRVPIFVGGTHFYFYAFFNGLPKNIPPNPKLRAELDMFSNEELFARVGFADARRAKTIDPQNKRKLIRALEIINALGSVPEPHTTRCTVKYMPEWLVMSITDDILRTNIDARLQRAFTAGLIDETRHIRKYVGDNRLNEFGLEYRIIGEYLRGEREKESLFPTLSAKLWQYVRHQKAWLRKLVKSTI